ncbi:Na-translocating system protein MpsC family protein [Neobacillus sp. PS3-40]|uniref:Na-translocating system protein MpsC family protein n=1 Tax=Neobacillus sp. PS3-40 TaxID=3070679 RepID=UPI0035A82A64
MSEAFIKLQRKLIGRSSQEAKAYIVGDMVIIRFKGVLTWASCCQRSRKKTSGNMHQVLREMYSGYAYWKI